jgi:uncharacterized protein
VPTSFRSYFTHRSKNLALEDVVQKWTLPAIAGVATGSAVAAVAARQRLQEAFAVIAAVIAAKLLFGRASWRVANDLPRGPLLWLFDYLVGLASSLMGVSGGSVANIIMMLYGKTIHTAVATSAGLGVPIATVGTIGFMLAGLPRQDLMLPLSIGYVSLIGFIVMAPVSSYVAGFGARLAHKIPPRHLEIIFGLFLAGTAVRFMIASAHWSLSRAKKCGLYRRAKQSPAEGTELSARWAGLAKASLRVRISAAATGRARKRSAFWSRWTLHSAPPQ